MTGQTRGTDRAGRRKKRFLSPSEKHEIWLQVIRQEVTMGRGRGAVAGRPLDHHADPHGRQGRRAGGLAAGDQGQAARLRARAGTDRERAVVGGAQGDSGPAHAGGRSCANYLANKADYLDYPTALAAGWPIATGIIEGACRHPVKDCMDLTGARWGLNGAEAILKLRALRANGDYDDYWSRA